MRRLFLHPAIALAVIMSMLLPATLVFAGTTGSVSGVLTDSSGAPIAAARVTATSPSQSATTTSDLTGRFSFLSLAPDTYALSFEKAGYEPAAQSGVTVQADQRVVSNLTASKRLQTIGRTSARATNDLVRPGVTASVYSVNATQQAAAAALGGGTNLNSAYSAIASVPGVVVPLGNAGWGQSIFIRGGDSTQTGNEVDGIPINRAFDQYSGSALSSLGNQEVQVYTGNSPPDAQAVGLSGFVNQVIKTGTNPGYISADLGSGAPGFYSKANLEFAGAAPNRMFSYYLATGGYEQNIRLIDQFNGAGYLAQSGFGSLYNFTATGCGTPHPSVGCYANAANSPFLGQPFGPNGYGVAPLIWGYNPTVSDRETIANLHFGIPHKHDGLRDDVQFLYNVAQDANYPNASMTAWGPVLSDVVNGTVNGVPGVQPGVTPVYRDQNRYTGARYAPFTAADLNLVQNAAFSNSPAGRPLGAPVAFTRTDGQTNAFSIEKLQYQHTFSDKAYARVYGYSLYSDWLENGIQGVYQTYVSTFTPDYQVSSHTRGAALSTAYQIVPEHLISLNFGYTTSNVVRDRNDVASGLLGESQVAYLVNSLNPTGGCYAVAGGLPTQVGCPKASGYILPPVNKAGPLTPIKGSPLVGTEGALTCGTGPCQYFAINDGSSEARNTVVPKFFNAALSDTWKPTARLSIDASLRLDTYSYDMQNTNTLGNQLFVNDYNASHCVAETTIATRAYGSGCAAGFAPAALTVKSPNLSYPNILQPRFGATYTLNPTNVFRASYGRFTQPPETSSIQSTSVQSGTPSTTFYKNFGFPSFTRNVVPEISYNTDFSWEHQVRGTDASWRITPFNRQTVNEFATVLVDPKTNSIAFVNGQNRTANGFELALNKGDFNRNGFSSRLSYTYTYAYNKYRVFPNGSSFVNGINGSIQGFNAYTKFCATNPTNARCAGATTQSGGAAPCYTLATTTATGATTPGAADPGCAVTSIANPYWNAQPGALLDPTAAYAPYSQEPTFGTGEVTGSYTIPHVASLIVQYKRDRLRVTPSVQFQAGTRYGSPLVSGGVAPDTCTAALPGNPTAAGDPRYSSAGALGGAGYDASSCSGIVNIPDPFTAKFDGIGSFRQPNLINANLQLSYDLSKAVTIQMTAANVYSNCFGGSNVPWAIGGRLGCNYAGAQGVGNFYNPGDRIQNGFRYPYAPTLAGSLQSTSTTAATPFAIFFDLKLNHI